jgi:hypothetical protein
LFFSRFRQFQISSRAQGKINAPFPSGYLERKNKNYDEINASYLMRWLFKAVLLSGAAEEFEFSFDFHRVYWDYYYVGYLYWYQKLFREMQEEM